MTRHDDLVYLGHMLETAKRANALVAGFDKARFDGDETLQLALARLLQIIGEAARRVDASVRLAVPEIPWADVVGMRNKLVHDYLATSYELVWSTVIEDLPPLIEALEQVHRRIELE